MTEPPRREGAEPPRREGAIEPPATGHSRARMPEHPLETEQARQGSTLGHMRWVLLVSLVLVVLGFILSAVIST
ncbi:hypothetical protein NON00_00680 [Roseomonas sp. GC11]|uniref:hypothetical protein n=1 Tax=Roseomonas sp. GC11 TaxID=2950546 RepID=UPI0021092F45|nr:hypothetical protein [Roseomonas sp. GC11]MCQ4158442.1 hypothetical protein [Roseomonas sp. GC11]